MILSHCVVFFILLFLLLVLLVGFTFLGCWFFFAAVNNVRAAVNNMVWDKLIGRVLKMPGVPWESAVLRGV